MSLERYQPKTMEGLDSSVNSTSSNSTNDELSNLITLISEHLSSHPIEDFDLHVGNLLDDNGKLGLLNFYQVGSLYIHIPIDTYLLNHIERLTILFKCVNQA